MSIEIIKRVNLFSELDDNSLHQLAAKLSIRNYPKNTVLINEGDESDSLYVILDGKVKTFLRDEDGKEIILNFQHEGEYFGELSLLDGEARSCSVMTIMPSKFAVMVKKDFDTLLRHNGDLAMRLLRQMSKRLRALTTNVKSLALMDVYGRVAKVLIEMSENDGNDKMVIKQKLTQQDIANLVGASREMVTRIIKDLTTGGYIQIENKFITINHRLPTAW